MRLQRLAAQNFRNLADLDLDTDAQFVVFHGPNAQGKTNVLEAIYYLATLKPLRGYRPRDLVRFGEGSASVAGRVFHAGTGRQHRVDIDNGSRSLKIDGQRADLEAWFEGLRAICFQPSDGEIVSGEPSIRRKWVDRATFTARPGHLAVVRNYKRALEQKSAALKTNSEDALLDVLDTQLAQAGGLLALQRAQLLDELRPHVVRVHESIVGDDVALSLRYRTKATGGSLEERTENLLAALRKARPNERRRQITLVGPQTDDVIVKLEDHKARTFASRGQVRSLVLSLKLAELVAARARGDVPMFLLDDVSSELDRGRTARLVALLSDLGAQVFATTTDPEHIEALPGSQTRRVRVEDGVLFAEG